MKIIKGLSNRHTKSTSVCILYIYIYIYIYIQKLYEWKLCQTQEKEVYKVHNVLGTKAQL
jgi:hypothetical protein